ncbi:MAG: hypothetical protein EP338_08995 [Bacteroidetes bacterium]|nr:MAG: hypothetical protein EP338_08995 [Bacteroidota bacterium]
MVSKLGKHIAIGFFLLGAVPLWAQWKEVDKSVFQQAILKAEKTTQAYQSYYFETRYDFYEQLDASETSLSYEGYVWCTDNKKVQMLQFDRLILQDEFLHITVDSARGMIALKEADSLLLRPKTELDFASFMKSEVKAYIYQGKQVTKYMLEFPEGTKYRSVELWLDRRNLVRKYVLLGGKQIVDNSGTEDRVLQPRLEISYQNYQFENIKVKHRREELDDYILQVEEDGTRKVTLRDKYQTFTLADLRWHHKEN